MVYILLSTFNGENFLDEQIVSLKKQCNTEYKILVRDDGSTDSTPQILDKWKKKGILEWYRGSNLGYAKSFLDLIITAPDVDYYALCDQDDIWFPDKLERAVNCLKQLSRQPKLYCSNLYIYRNGINEGLWWKTPPQLSLYSALVQNVATGCTVVFNRDLRDIIKRNVPNSITLHDFWLYHTALLFGSVYFDFEAHIYYRQHSGNQIGAKSRVIDKIKSKIRSISSLRKQHYREEEAKQLLCIYNSSLSEKDRNIIKLIAHYKEKLLYKLILFLSPKYKMQNLSDTVWLKIRILIGCI